jgi:23S rRNA (cytidine1920-2'-O)/16S rRNA (cytidine1409-2'-O)-methyltransferase
MSTKERVDVLAVNQGLFASREQAKRAIMAGEIYTSDMQRLDKAGVKIPADTELVHKGHKLPYVSRGGLKLAKAKDVFHMHFQDQIVLDIGASTGGFTDVALQNGARLVYALDVGYNQLAYSLREDPRVDVMERVNFRYSKPEDFTHGVPSIAVTDVSFISLELILPPLKAILAPHGQAVVLVKPQFEAGRENVGKGGIVRDPAIHVQVLQKIIQFAAADGYAITGLDFSPVTGGSGNIEFLLALQNELDPQTSLPMDRIESVVDAAWATLKHPGQHHEHR